MFKFFESLVDPYTAYADSDTPPDRTIPFLLAFVRPFRRVLAVNIATSFLVALTEVGLIWYLGRLIDLLTGAEPKQFWADHGVELAVIFVFLLILRPLLQTLDTALIKNAVQPNLAALARWRSYRHVLRQPVGWFENDFAGRISSRVVQMPGALGNLAFQVMDTFTFAIAYVVGSALLLANADPKLLIPLALWLVLYIALLRWAIKRVRPASRASSAARSKTLGFIVDSFSNIQSVKLFSHTKSETDFALGILENHRITYSKETRITTLIEAGLVALNGLLIVSIVGWALVMWTNGTASVGTVAAAGTLALRINAMTGWFMGALAAFFRDLGVVNEGMETVAQPITMQDIDSPKPLRLQGGAISVQEVSHHYGRGQGGLSHVSFDIAPGEKIGLVGRSGAGKSTLVKALLRLFDPEKGRILIDGQDVALVPQEMLRAQIGMVQQETSLLHRTIRENIRYGRPDATDADIIAAAKQAEAHAFITDLRDQYGNRGYDVRVGERGVKLSGGQRQRVALARVILKDAPILLLDEATSALDSEVEAQIQRTLYGMMAGKTVIAIAHRLSTIAQMDRILVMEDGRIVEDGTHDSLLAAKGPYAGFWARQSGGFLSVDDNTPLTDL